MNHRDEHRQRVLEQFSRQAIPFARLPAHGDGIALLAEMARIGEIDEVLDVACGPGLVACALAPGARHVTGVDVTPAMLEQARCRQRESGVENVDWRQCEADALPFATGSFSRVLSRYSFHHMLAPVDVLTEMVRVCRPGGWVLLADVAMPEACRDGFDALERLRDASHVRALTQGEFARLFAESGLEDLQCAEYAVTVELEAQLAASFPEAGDAEQIRALVAADVGVDALGIAAERRDGLLYYRYPIWVMVGRKPGG